MGGGVHLPLLRRGLGPGQAARRSVHASAKGRRRTSGAGRAPGRGAPRANASRADARPGACVVASQVLTVPTSPAGWWALASVVREQSTAGSSRRSVSPPVVAARCYGARDHHTAPSPGPHERGEERAMPRTLCREGCFGALQDAPSPLRCYSLTGDRRAFYRCTRPPKPWRRPVLPRGDPVTTALLDPS